MRSLCALSWIRRATDLAPRSVGTCQLVGIGRMSRSSRYQRAIAAASHIPPRSSPSPCLPINLHRLCRRRRAVSHLPPPPNNRHKHSQTSTSHVPVQNQYNAPRHGCYFLILLLSNHCVSSAVLSFENYRSLNGNDDIINNRKRQINYRVNRSYN